MKAEDTIDTYTQKLLTATFEIALKLGRKEVVEWIDNANTQDWLDWEAKLKEWGIDA